MASMDLNLTVVRGPEETVMDEATFKQYLLRLLREAINEEDAVVIQPSSYQAVVLRDGD